jgi:hypothetical protein
MANLKYLVYIIEGAIMFGANLIVLLAVLRYKALRLRKEYVLVAAVSLANGLNGAAYFYAGVYRTYYTAIG